MGTNYYLRELDTEYLHHIGKSSAGWCFSLHVHESFKPHTLEDWLDMFQLPSTQIENEYGNVVSVKFMLAAILNRSGQPFTEKPYGYESWEKFHEKNCSEFGPNNLLRHKIGKYCIGHGEGTWDYMVGNFI